MRGVLWCLDSWDGDTLETVMDSHDACVWSLRPWILVLVFQSEKYAIFSYMRIFHVGSRLRLSP